MRFRLGVLGALLIVVLHGPTPAAAAPRLWFLPEGRANRAATPLERTSADAFVTAARASFTHWPDPATAMHDGYEPQTQGELVHFVNRDALLAPGQQPDPTRPTALVFLLTSTTSRLVGAMWMEASPSTPGPDFGGPLTPWHAHVECAQGWSIQLIPVGSHCAPGAIQQTTPEMLHVWEAGVADPYASDMTLPLLCTIR
jgi:hypothetical protein